MKKLLAILFCFSLLSLISCEDIFDCTLNRRPELPEKPLEIGRVGSAYFQQFDAGIKNEPRDNNYGYNFEIYGDIPDGLEVTTENRTVTIDGFPIIRGNYQFTIVLNVDPPTYYDQETEQYEDGMCSTSTSQEYEIIIN